MEDNKSPTYELAEQDYIAGMKYKDIAEKYSVSINTVKSWKVRYNWSKGKKSVHTKKKKVCTQKKELESEKKPIAKEVEEVIENGDLTEKQRLFCLYYIEDFNATKAYKRAYGCSYETAMVEGCKCLRKPKIKKEIDRLTGECLEEKEIDSKLFSKRVLQKNIDIAFADMTDYVKFGRRELQLPEGPRIVNYVDLIDSAEVDGTIVTEVSQGKDGVKVKLADRMRALDFLAKYNGMFSTESSSLQQVIFEGEDELED